MSVLKPGKVGDRPIERRIGWSQVGWAPRVVMSLISGLALLSGALFAGGLLALTRGIAEGSAVLLTLGMAGLVWSCALTGIWTTYRFFIRTLKIIPMVMAVWLACSLVNVLIAEVFWSSWFSSMILLVLIPILIAVALIATIWLPAKMLRRHGIGERIFLGTGEVNVRCPGCGYSMVGLSECRCPECGTQYTIDALIARQGYGVLRFDRQAPQPAQATDSTDAERKPE